jgi:hypothetical protein
LYYLMYGEIKYRSLLLASASLLHEIPTLILKAQSAFRETFPWRR